MKTRGKFSLFNSAVSVLFHFVLSRTARARLLNSSGDRQSAQMCTFSARRLENFNYGKKMRHMKFQKVYKSEDESMGARERSQLEEELKELWRVKRGISTASPFTIKIHIRRHTESVASLRKHIFLMLIGLFTFSIAFKQFEESSFYCRTRV